MVSCPSSMVSAVCVVPFPPHAGGFLTLSISATTDGGGFITVRLTGREQTGRVPPIVREYYRLTTAISVCVVCVGLCTVR